MRKSEKGRLYRAAAAGMTAAMIMTMGGMSAFAAETDITTLDVTKVISASSSDAIKAPNTSFTFQVNPAEKGTTLTNDKGETIVVYPGVTGGASFAAKADTVTFKPGDDLTEKTALTFDKGVFEKPGVYRYEVTETEGTYDGMTYDKTVYYVDLYVTNGENGLVISNVIVSKKDGDKTDNLTFTNDYKTNNLSVTKKITGNQANKEQKFEFTITITGQDGEEFAGKLGDTDYTFKTGEAVKVELGDEDTIEIYGLSASDTYEIVETSYAADGYTTTIAGADNTDNLTATGDVADGDDAVVYTNTKNVTTPTGIVMSYAPYVLLVGAAGGFGALFFRKKREEF